MRTSGRVRSHRRTSALIGVVTVGALLAAACNVRPHDYDGDKKADIVYTTGGAAGGAWMQVGVTTPLWAGLRGDAVGGDYDNDGTWEPAELLGRDWYSSKLAAPIHFDPAGLPTAAPAWPASAHGGGGAILPVPADYDGDGDTDPAYYAVVDGTWWISGQASATPYGTPPALTGGLDWDIPVPADYDGDKKADIAVFHPTDSTFHILQSKTGTERIVQVGAARGNLPVPADYDGDGRADPAVTDPTGHVWWITPGTSTPDFSFTSTPVGYAYPVAADYDGDGRADPAVYDNRSRVLEARIGGSNTTLATLASDAFAMPAFPFAEVANIVRITAFDACMRNNPPSSCTTP